MGTTKKRKLLYTLSCVVVAAILLTITFPIWLPWILRPMLGNFGIQFAQYDRDGFRKFVLRDVKYPASNFVFTAEQVEVRNDRRIQISNWTLEFLESNKVESASPSVHELSGKVESTLSQLNRWISQIQLREGQVKLDKTTLMVDSLAYNRGGSLHGNISATNFPITEISALFNPGTNTFSIRFRPVQDPVR